MSILAPILAGVLKVAISSPSGFNLFIADRQNNPHTSMAEFADDKIIYTSQEDPAITRLYLQNHLNSISSWCSKCKIKVNNDKSSHITFTLKQDVVAPVTLYSHIISMFSSVYYLD